MNCPECDFPNAYQGALRVECANRKCRHWTQKQEDAVIDRTVFQRPESGRDTIEFSWDDDTVPYTKITWTLANRHWRDKNA